jgi:general secretion pathway protein I
MNYQAGIQSEILIELLFVFGTRFPLDGTKCFLIIVLAGMTLNGNPMLAINHQHKAQGFTLLEVMVALMIVAVVLLSLLRITALQANHLRYLEQKNIAQWIAVDTIAKIRVGLIPLSTSQGDIQGTTNQLNQNWYWFVHFTSTADPRAFRAQVAVKTASNGNSLVSFITYFSTSG